MFTQGREKELLSVIKVRSPLFSLLRSGIFGLVLSPGDERFVEKKNSRSVDNVARQRNYYCFFFTFLRDNNIRPDYRGNFPRTEMWSDVVA